MTEFDDIVIERVCIFLKKIPKEIGHNPDMAVFVPYYVLEHIKTFTESASNIVVDIDRPFQLFGTRFFVGYENYFVACVIKSGGIDPKATFKMPIE